MSASTVRDIHKLLRNCFEQAIKWEMLEKNPCIYATVPKHKSQKREIWTAETLMYAMDVCEDQRLKLAINLSFSCSMRLGELLGLTWDCVDISPEAIEENRAYVYINKETQRVKKESLKDLEGKDVLLVFPSQHKTNTTVQILKTPKTESRTGRSKRSARRGIYRLQSGDGNDIWKSDWYRGNSGTIEKTDRRA